jgi:hypothetical protein
MNHINTIIIYGLIYTKLYESSIKFICDFKNIKNSYISQYTYNRMSEYEYIHIKLNQYINDTIVYETWYTSPFQFISYDTSDISYDTKSI